MAQHHRGLFPHLLVPGTYLKHPPHLCRIAGTVLYGHTRNVCLYIYGLVRL